MSKNFASATIAGNTHRAADEGAQHRKVARARAAQLYIDSFLEYKNKFLSVEGWADYHMFREHEARVVINKGRVLHQDKFGQH